MTDTAQPTTTAQAAPTATGDGPSPRSREWRGRITKTRAYRTELTPEWSENIDYRRGKPFESESDQDRIQVPVDWSMTKAKHAQLFSQVPEVRLTHVGEAYRLAMPMFAQKVNTALKAARVGVAMDECLPDCINAAGVGAVLVAFESLTVPKQLPTATPEQVTVLKSQGLEVPMSTVPQTTDARFTITRVSPADLLWALEFTGSDFDDSPWVGNSGRKSWPDAKAAWKLDDSLKEKVLTGDKRQPQEMLGSQDDVQKGREKNVVSYDQIFYHRHIYHPDETNFNAIQRMVFVDGIDEPVVDELWTGQQREGLRIYGAQKYPLRFLTLTYLTDESIPPSDSAMGRPQVNELNRSHSQMIRNRETSGPLRWFDTTKVDTAIQTNLMRGTWQGMIPMNGDGSRAIGEVARAAFPNDDYNFDNINKADLRETWQVEDTIGMGPAIRSAEEARNRQSNFQTRIGYERARCASFFVGIAEVVAGLYALYGQFTPEDLQLLQPQAPPQSAGDGMAPAAAPPAPIDKRTLGDCYNFNVRADSTMLLDAGQRIERLTSFLNITAKSGYVNVGPVIAEIVELVGLDPAKVMTQPAEKGPDPLNTSLRLTGAADLNDPFVIAMLMLSGQAPSLDMLNKAKLLLATIQQQPGMDGQPVGPGAPGAPGGLPAAPGAAAAPPVSAGPGIPAGRGPELKPPYTTHEDYNTASRVEKRAEDGK